MNADIIVSISKKATTIHFRIAENRFTSDDCAHHSLTSDYSQRMSTMSVHYIILLSSTFA